VAIQGLDRLLQSASETVPQDFRDAWACHVYMLYSLHILLESSPDNNNYTSSAVDSNTTTTSTSHQTIREIATTAMLTAAQSMATHRTTLWIRSVPDESVLVVPCRMAYRLLPGATGVAGRKAVCARILAVTAADAPAALLTTMTAALMDLLHSYEHMAALTAELCAEETVTRLAVELMRDVGRLEAAASSHDTSVASSGIKLVAPFVSSLAQVRPKLVLQHLHLLLPHLDSEPYNLRSAVVTAISHILVGTATEGGADETTTTTTPSSKTRDTLLDLLMDRAYDVSSYTRSTVLKAWIRLVATTTETTIVPKERILPLCRLAMDRLQDKTVLVRKQAMQVCVVHLFCFVETWSCCGSLFFLFDWQHEAVDRLARKQSIHGESRPHSVPTQVKGTLRLRESQSSDQHSRSP
jgi:condensin complex subunit 1